MLLEWNREAAAASRRNKRRPAAHYVSDPAFGSDGPRLTLFGEARGRCSTQTAGAFWINRVTTQALVFEIGRHSEISTTSPDLHSLFSSCA